MAVKTYRKTAFVTAEQFLPAIGQIPNGVYSDGHGDPRKRPDCCWVLDTKEGRHNVRGGDYICTGPAGEQWNVAKEIFEATYSEVSASPYPTAWDDVRRYVEGLEEEVGRLEDENSELRYEPWPEWARAVLKVIRSHTGYDGYDDAADGVDMPLELSEHLSQIESDTDRWKSRAEAAEARIAELEKEKHAALTMIVMLEKQLAGKE